jgi:hypothetical protein
MTESKKRAMELSEEETEREKRKKKNAKKEETRQQKAVEQSSKAQAWSSFAQKGAKKGMFHLGRHAIRLLTEIEHRPSRCGTGEHVQDTG